MTDGRLGRQLADDTIIDHRSSKRLFRKSFALSVGETWDDINCHFFSYNLQKIPGCCKIELGPPKFLTQFLHKFLPDLHTIITTSPDENAKKKIGVLSHGVGGCDKVTGASRSKYGNNLNK